jgi:hypothetical protein
MDYDKNPYKDDPLPARPKAIGRLTEAAIALLLAFLAVYLAS